MGNTKVHLSQDQRSHLENLVRAGKSSARVQTRARILLLSDRSTGKSRQDAEVAEALMISAATVGRIRRRFVSEGPQSALCDKPRPGRVPKITGDIEAKLTVLACSSPPDGHATWTLKLLADQLVELGLIQSVCTATICKRLKKRSKTLADKDLAPRLPAKGSTQQKMLAVPFRLYS
jgi:transposase